MRISDKYDVVNKPQNVAHTTRLRFYRVLSEVALLP